MCNKMAFPTKKEAVTHIKVTKHSRHRFDISGKLKPYLCRECEQYHLTSKKKMKHGGYQ